MTVVRFEWDEAKAAATLKKHGVSFEIALKAFADPFARPFRIASRMVSSGGKPRAGWASFCCSLWLISYWTAEMTTRQSKSSASFRLGRPTARKGDVMKKKGDSIVRYDLDLANPPPLTANQKAELAALAELSDDDIDYSDIPPLTDEQYKEAVSRRFYRPVKQQITARVDADVLAWLKAQGKGYQARMNAILRREMLAALKSRQEQKRS